MILGENSDIEQIMILITIGFLQPNKSTNRPTFIANKNRRNRP